MPTATFTEVPERFRIGNTVGNTDQDAVVPSVFRNFPELPVCDGKLTGAAAHEAVVPLEVNRKPLEPIGKRVALLLPLPMIKSPVVVIGDIALNAADAVV